MAVERDVVKLTGRAGLQLFFSEVRDLRQYGQRRRAVGAVN